MILEFLSNIENRYLLDPRLLAHQYGLLEWLILTMFGLFSGIGLARILYYQRAPIKLPEDDAETVTNPTDGTIFPPLNPRAKDIRIVYILDVSRSMNQNHKIERSKAHLVDAIERLPATAKYQVIFFNGMSWFAHQEATAVNGYVQTIEDKDQNVVYTRQLRQTPQADWINATKGNKLRTIFRINQVETSIGNDWGTPFRMSLEMHPKIINFLTDGSMANADTRIQEIISLVDESDDEITINTIAVDEESAKTPLYNLAKHTNGECRFVDNRGMVSTVEAAA